MRYLYALFVYLVAGGFCWGFDVAPVLSAFLIVAAPVAIIVFSRKAVLWQARELIIRKRD